MENYNPCVRMSVEDDSMQFNYKCTCTTHHLIICDAGENQEISSVWTKYFCFAELSVCNKLNFVQSHDPDSQSLFLKFL